MKYKYVFFFIKYVKYVLKLCFLENINWVLIYRIEQMVPLFLSWKEMF